MNSSVPPLSPPLMRAALSRMPTTIATNDQNSVVLNAALVSVARRRARPVPELVAPEVRAMPPGAVGAAMGGSLLCEDRFARPHTCTLRRSRVVRRPNWSPVPARHKRPARYRRSAMTRTVDTTSLTQRSATRLARAIREGEVSSREVVEAHLEVLERVNPRINAVVVPRFDEARGEAGAAAARPPPARGAPGPAP